jgi:hypothetical protein
MEKLELDKVSLSNLSEENIFFLKYIAIIEDKINEIVEEKNQQDEINKKLVENIDKILSFLNL